MLCVSTLVVVLINLSVPAFTTIAIATRRKLNKMTAICLGPCGSGKTLLIKKLQNFNSVDETSSSIPTTGTNIFSLKNGNNLITIRELGGSMAPIWSNYFDNVKKVIYVVDTSNLCQVSAAGVLFYSILANPKLKKSEILLVLTKMDVSYRQMRNEALLMLQIKRLQKEVTQKITIIESSAITGEGCNHILEWLKNGSAKV